MGGINRQTGKPLSGWDHVLQSINVIMTTRRGARVMRRQFGSTLPRLVDRSVSPNTLIDFFAAIADAIKDEPRFRLVKVELSEADSDLPNGNPVFDISGIYYPRGHLGDLSEAQDVTGKVVLAM